ncbi:MAG: hypothetical protein HYU88_02915 [Chloroflexi bacterium]|nr:hypothetical protein [Chloroflexota bacterium]
MRAGLVALLAALAFALATPAPALAEGGALAGQVVDGTNDERPLPEWPVLLHLFAGSEWVETRQAQTDAQGRFRFADLPTDPDRSFVVTTTRADVLYTSDVVRLSGGEGERSVTVFTFEPVDNDADIVLESVNLAVTEIDAIERLATVIEVQNVVNVGKRTYIGSRRPDGSVAGTIVMRLPPGARDFDVGPGLRPDSVVPTPRGFVTLTPVLPGRMQVTFGYRMPYEGSGLGFDKSLPFPTEALRVLAPVEYGLSAPGLEPQGEVALGSQRYRLFVSGGLARDASVRVELATLPAPPLIRPPKPDELARVGIALAVLAALAIPFAYVRRRPRAAAAAVAPADLQREREELLRAIAALDDRYAAGGMPAADYEQERAAHKERLLAITTCLNTAQRREAHSGT